MVLLHQIDFGELWSSKPELHEAEGAGTPCTVGLVHSWLQCCQQSTDGYRLFITLSHGRDATRRAGRSVAPSPPVRYVADLL